MRVPFPIMPIATGALCAACSTPRPPAFPPAPTPVSISSDQRPELLVRLGSDMRRDGDAAGAVNLYRTASLTDPRDPKMLQHMGDAFLEMNDPARAEQAFRGALSVAPGDTAANRGLALSLLAKAGHPSRFQSLQGLADGSSDPHLLRAEATALDILGRQSEAQPIYRKALRFAPIDANLHGNLALSLAISGDSGQALQEMQAARGVPQSRSASKCQRGPCARDDRQHRGRSRATRRGGNHRRRCHTGLTLQSRTSTHRNDASSALSPLVW